MAKARFFRLIRIACIGCWLVTGGAAAQGTSPPPGAGPAAHGTAPALPATPEAIDHFVAMLSDAEARALLLQALRAAVPPAPGAASEAGAPAAPPPSLLEMLRDRSAEVGQSLDAVGQALDRLSDSLDAVTLNLTDADKADRPAVIGHALLVFLAMLAAGLAAELLLRRAARAARPHAPLARGAAWGARLRALALRFAIDLLSTLAFSAAAYLASFLFFERYDPLREFVATLLLTVTCARLGRDVAALVLAPRAPALRLLPVGDMQARRLQAWVVTLAGATGFAVFSTSLLRILGLEEHLLLLYRLLAGLAVLLLAAAVLARRLRGPTAAAAPPSRPAAPVWPLFAVAYLAAVWCVWAVNLLLGRADAAAAALSSLVVLTAVLAVDQVVLGALHAVLASAAGAADGRPAGGQRLIGVLRPTLRTVGALAALALLADGFGLGAGAWLATPAGRAAAGAALDIAVTLVLALMAWHGVRHLIDRQLAKAEQARPTEGAAAQFSTRAETLLPLLRNFVLVVLLAMTTMIVLSSLGIDIGPLIAGAGIVGLAIGFGSQTLVKDIVAGVFFLIDDAFRVGEYVETGDKRGTVEAISLRSLRLRHHRGPLHTIPFGELQAVTNYSRGWVIEKIELNVTYDTDLDKLKKIIKQVSREISEEPEFKRVILEPPKSQGVDRLADFSMVVRIKFKSLPGEQFVLRRELYRRLKRAFDANGISFAFPTVTIHQTGGGPAEGAQVAAEAAAAAAGLGTKPAAPGG